MLKLKMIALTIATLTPQLVSAEMFLEGLMEFTQAPNCVDEYALFCGRYDRVDISNEIAVSSESEGNKFRVIADQTSDFRVVKGSNVQK